VGVTGLAARRLERIGRTSALRRSEGPFVELDLSCRTEAVSLVAGADLQAVPAVRAPAIR
jgi:hypothetical protein